MKVKQERTVGVIYHHSTLHAMEVVDRVWRKLVGQHARITGLGEEGHSEGSRHYGRPGDIRTMAFDVDADIQHLPVHLRHVVHEELQRRLGEDEYDLVWEGMDSVHAHLHVEVDPKS